MVETQTQAVQQTNNAQADNSQKAPTNVQNATNLPSAEDIVSRASQVSLKSAKSEQPGSDEDLGFDRNQWNEMVSKLPPDQKQMLESAYKSLQSGAQKKFQKASDLIRQAQEMANQPWTPDRVAQLTRDPNFVQAAQAYAQAQTVNQNPQQSGLSDEEWSALSEKERAQFHQVMRNQQALQYQLDNMMLGQENDKLSQRYKNYDTSKVNQIRTDLLNGRLKATNEHLWKVIDYDDAVQRAYQLGIQDRKMDLTEKQNAATVQMGGMNVTQADDVPGRGKGESIPDYFKRLAQRNMSKLKQAQ